MLKIDIGCGGRGTRFPGFTGLDVHPVPSGVTNYIQRDVAKDGLPFEDRSVHEAICTHVLEHMSREDGERVLQEIYRVLKQGEYLYLSVPDLMFMAQRYVEGDVGFYEKPYENGQCIWSGDTIADKFLDSIIGMGKHGHRYGYDAASLAHIVTGVGFTPTIPPRSDCPYWTADRKIYSVMLVCMKPFKE